MTASPRPARAPLLLAVAAATFLALVLCLPRSAPGWLFWSALAASCACAFAWGWLGAWRRGADADT